MHIKSKSDRKRFAKMNDKEKRKYMRMNLGARKRLVKAAKHYEFINDYLSVIIDLKIVFTDVWHPYMY